METIKRSVVVQGWGMGTGEKKIGKAQRIFRALKVLSDTLTVDTCH